MIIKEADDKKEAISALQALLARSDCTVDVRKRIEQEIRNVQAGIRGEEEAAYEMKVHWGESENWMIIHDLRIEIGGLVAQIDHLILNRFMEIWVCESKNFSEGVSINEHGEFTAFFGGRPYGVPSPVEQNAKHVLILNRLFDSGAVKLPVRLGFTLKPNLKSLVLVSQRARISRPTVKLDGLDCIVKSDQLFKTIDKAFDQGNSLRSMAKIVGRDTLEALARDIANCHRPITFNWPAKFGLLTVEPKLELHSAAKPVARPSFRPAEAPIANVVDVDPAADGALRDAPAVTDRQKPRQKLVCHACGVAVTYNVAKFCWFNKPRFGGNVYCIECQKTVPAPQE